MLRGLSWEVRTKFFCDSIAHAIDLATLKPEIEEDIERKAHEAEMDKLKKRKLGTNIDVRTARKHIPLEVRGRTNDVMRSHGVKENVIIKLGEAEHKRNQVSKLIRIKSREWLMKREMD